MLGAHINAIATPSIFSPPYDSEPAKSRACASNRVISSTVATRASILRAAADLKADGKMVRTRAAPSSDLSSR
jgi:hypothetical protein